MQRLGDAWSCLSPTKKKDYVDRSKAEFDAQGLSPVKQGLCKRSCAGTAKLAAIVASEQEIAKQDAPQENPAPSQSLQIGTTVWAECLEWANAPTAMSFWQ